MSDQLDGGPAFPRIANLSIEKMDGMTLRAYAAVSSLQGLLASGPHDCDEHGLAHDAVIHADALLSALKEREKARR